MKSIYSLSLAAAVIAAGAGALLVEAGAQQPAASASSASVAAIAPAANIYAQVGANMFSPAVQGQLERVYVPNLRSNEVYVIDPPTAKVIDKFKVGRSPQHVVPAWDLKTLWVANNAEGRTDGSLTPIDPMTGKPGKSIPVDDPYNMYFTPDGKSAIVVAEAKKRLDFRDPQTMKLQYSVDMPWCAGVNHADFSIDNKYAIFTCEFSGTLAKVDLEGRKVMGYLKLQMPQLRFKEGSPAEGPLTEICTTQKGMPQDIRISPDGKRFFIADMHADGVHVIDGDAFKQVGFIPTGLGAHGLYPSRDGTKLYVANRSTHKIHGGGKGPGSVSVIDFATQKVVQTIVIPGGGSPDMGNVSADGKTLWLSGRYDNEVYKIDIASGQVTKIPVGLEPHGLTVWPQPGRYSLGHTGNLR